MLSNERFYEWHAPVDMLIENRFLRIELKGDVLKRKGRHFRESFIAAHFAQHRQADAVRLIKEENTPTPDFALRFGKTELWYEITEADRPSRRRGEEIIPSEPQPVKPHEWTEPDDYFLVVRALASKKAQKAYARCDGLIIYDNAWPITRPQIMDAVWWKAATEPAQATFSEVWRASEGFERIS